MSERFQNQIVWITGSSSGIGEALATEFAKQGAKVVLSARREQRIQDLATILSKQYHVETLAVPCDVRSATEVKAAVQTILTRFGRLDVAVANAGFGVVGEVMDLTVEDFQRQFDTNVYGLLHTVYASVPELEKSKGRLVLMGSVLSYLSGPERAPYSASKYSVRAIAESLYFELLKKNISVTLINPGLVKSEIRKVDNRGVFHARAENNYTPLHMDAEVAAKKMVRAIYCRRREVMITLHGKLLVWFARHFPVLIRLLFRLGVKGRRRVDSP